MVGVAPYTGTRGDDNQDHLFQETNLTTKNVDYIHMGSPLSVQRSQGLSKLSNGINLVFVPMHEINGVRHLIAIRVTLGSFFKYRANNVLGTVMDEILSSNKNLGG